MAKHPNTAHNDTHDAPTGSGKKGKNGNAKALASARDVAGDASRRASEAIDASPLSVLAGGVALGVLIGAALPRLSKEQDLLRPVGEKLAETAKGAIGAAKETGYSELDLLGLTRTAAKNQAGKLLEGLIGALIATGSAAATSRSAKSDA